MSRFFFQTYVYYNFLIFSGQFNSVDSSLRVYWLVAFVFTEFIWCLHSSSMRLTFLMIQSFFQFVRFPCVVYHAYWTWPDSSSFMTAFVISSPGSLLMKLCSIDDTWWMRCFNNYGLFIPLPLQIYVVCGLSTSVDFNRTMMLCECPVKGT